MCNGDGSFLLPKNNNIGDITTKNYEQSKRFNRYYWLENGGKYNEVPYHEDNGRTQTVFVDATMFQTWEEWKPQADRAQNAAYAQIAPCGRIAWGAKLDEAPATNKASPGGTTELKQ